MSETKMVAIIFVGLCAFGAIASVAYSIKDTTVDVEKEKTKQLELQFKIDSLNAVRTHTK